MTSATEGLRRMLDESGVEWWQKKRHTCWKVSKGQEVEMWRAWEAPDGSLTLKVDYIYDLTPEQAIAATLGSCNCSDNCTNSERTGTCHMEQTGHVKVAGVDYYDDDYECSECGAEIFEGYNFCPMCGRRIEQ